MTIYERGRRGEYTVRDLATEAGLVAVRAAGSKGVADLLVIGNAVAGEVWAVNVKVRVWAGPIERAIMWEAWRGRDVVPILAFVDGSSVWWREVLPGGALGLVNDVPPWE